MIQLAHLPDRAVLCVTGEDRVSFLQGLVSNDVAAAGPGRAVWAALLTPQGKWLADFFITAGPDRLWLECEAGHAAMLTQRLGRFRMRARVQIAPTGLTVYAAWGGDLEVGWGQATPDPRLPDAGWRILTDAARQPNATAAEWDHHRLLLGLPDGSRDLETEKTTLMEAGFDQLQGVSWDKGCYMGQELTARTKYRGLLKRRLVPVRLEGPAPAPGTLVLLNGAEMGVMRSSQGDIGLALLRLEAISAQMLNCGTAVLRPHLPDWMTVRPAPVSVL